MITEPEQVDQDKKLTACYQAAWEEFTDAREQLNKAQARYRAAEKQKALAADQLINFRQRKFAI